MSTENNKITKYCWPWLPCVYLGSSKSRKITLTQTDSRSDMPRKNSLEIPMLFSNISEHRNTEASKHVIGV